MSATMSAPSNQPPRRAGRHFLQIPGPSPVPDRILRAMAGAVLDHRGPEFQKLGHRVLAGIKTIFKTNNPVIIFPSSGTGAWEAALVNVLSPGDQVLMYETGHFAALWETMASKLGVVTEVLSSDWRSGIDSNRIAERLSADTGHKIKAVCVVHNETSTGATSRIAAVRAAIDQVGHPALLMVDTISGLGSADYRHDEWGVDVSISGSQKGLMLPPGISFNAVSDKAIAVSKTATLPKMFWSWEDQIAHNKNGFFPYTPATNMLYALAEAIDMMHEEGMDRVFARHQRHAEATRRCVAAWGLENLVTNPAHFSPVLTAVLLPEGHNSDALRKVILEKFDMSLGTGLSKVAGRVFRIGHLGDTNDLTILGTLAGVEMGLGLAGVPHNPVGVQAAMAYLASTATG
jgi:alanine-glyoxylate transaminase / serine-glyoxylate transaminase / serine-pyruvate transaminase